MNKFLHYQIGGLKNLNTNTWAQTLSKKLKLDYCQFFLLHETHLHKLFLEPHVKRLKVPLHHQAGEKNGEYEREKRGEGAEHEN